MKRLLEAVMLAVAIWLGSTVLVAGEQQAAEAKPHVTLSLDQYQELFESARLQDVERRASDQLKRHEKEHENKMKELQQGQNQKEKKLEEDQTKMFPDHFQVLRHTARGCFNSSSPAAGVEGDVVSFDLELTVRVMESSSPRWTVVPLVNTSSSVASNWEVSKLSENNDARDEDSVAIDTVSDPSTLLLIRNDQQVLATNQSGLFKIQFQIFTRVQTTRNLHAMSISHLLYPLSHFSLRIAKGEQAKDPRKKTVALKDFSIQPASAILQIDDSSASPLSGDEDSSQQNCDTYLDLHATLPLTADSIQIRWSSVAVDAETSSSNAEADAAASEASAAAAPKTIDDAPRVTATHQVLHTIGEGILRSAHTVEFETGNREESPLGSVSFWVHGEGVRVTSVASHALQSWSIVGDNADGNNDGEEGNGKGSRQLVKAYFKTSQLDPNGALLHVQTETDRGNNDNSEADTSNEGLLLDLPRIECRNVIRQTGHIAIIKDANVEVHEQSITPTLSRCEPSDLSSRLRLNVDRPIVLSYKYFHNPQNALAVIKVKEHASIQTLQAAIDRFHYKAFVTPTHTVHSMILVMQSTKLQYLKVMGLPSTASKFTVLVNSEPARPVHSDDDDEDGTISILVPLLVGLQPEAANEGGTLYTSVELTYFSTFDEPLKNRPNGTIALDPPQFDLPVAISTAHLRLPEQYEYEFFGDMGEASKSLEIAVPEPLAYRKGKRVVRKDHKFTIVDDFWPEDDDDDNGSGSGGPMVVKMQTPRTGRSFFFQQTLVVDRKMKLSVWYKEPIPEEKPSWWKALWPKFLGRIDGRKQKLLVVKNHLLDNSHILLI